MKPAAVTFSGALSYIDSAPVSSADGMAEMVLFRMDSSTVSSRRTANEVFPGWVRNTPRRFLLSP